MSLRLPQLIAYLVVAVAASVLLCATATSAKLCSATDLPEPYKNESIRGKLRQVAAYTKVNGSRVTVKGAFEVVDGCNFRILNFTFLGGPSDGCRWYGFMGDAKENDVTAMKLSDNIVSSHSKVNSKLYPLTDVVGREVSFFDFNVVRLYCESSKVVLAQVELIDAQELTGLSGTTNTRRNSVSAAPLPMVKDQTWSISFITAALIVVGMIFVM